MNRQNILNSFDVSSKVVMLLAYRLKFSEKRDGMTGRKEEKTLTGDADARVGGLMDLFPRATALNTATLFTQWK